MQFLQYGHRRTNGPMDSTPMDGQTNGWTNGCAIFSFFTDAIDALKMMIFQQIWQFLQNQQTDRPTHQQPNRPTDQQIDQRMDQLTNG